MTITKCASLFSLAAIIGFLLPTLLVGCQFGKKDPAADGGWYEFNKLSTVCDPATGLCTVQSVYSRAKAPSSSGEGVKGFKANPITINERGEINSGGMSFKLTGGGKENPLVIYVGAGISFLSLVLLGWIGRSWLAAGIGMGLGISIAGLAFYPELAIASFALLAVAGAVVVIYSMREKYKYAKVSESLTDTVQLLKGVATEAGVSATKIHDIMVTTQPEDVQSKVMDIKKKKKIGTTVDPINSAYKR